MELKQYGMVGYEYSWNKLSRRTTHHQFKSKDFINPRWVFHMWNANIWIQVGQRQILKNMT